MQVQNVECHLAQAQLKRYLGGEELPEDLLVDLEHHIKNCPDCRKSAEGAGVEPLPSQAIATSKPRPPWAPVLDALKRKPAGATAPLGQPSDMLAEPGSEIAPGRAPKNRVKVALLTTALAAVLVAMTLISRDPTVIFGRKASESETLAAQQEGTEAAASEGTLLDAVREGTEQDPLEGVQPAAMGNVGGPIADVALMSAQRAAAPELPAALAQTPEAAPKAPEPEPRPPVAQERPVEPAPRAAVAREPLPAPDPAVRAGVRRIEVPEGVVIPEEPTLGERVVVAKPTPPPARPQNSAREAPRRNVRSGVGTTRVFDEKGRPIRP